MNIHRDTARDWLTIDFAEEIEARSVYKDGTIVRYDKAGHVIGIDITDSMELYKIKHTMEGNRYRFRKSDVLNLAEGRR